MLIEERLCEILKEVEKKKVVTVQELTKLLNTSESTIRRDLTILHNRGRLVKVHGGATAVEISYNSKEDDVEIRKDRNTEEKVLIAKKAASLISPGDFIYIDAGTTTEIMTDYIEEKDAVYVTNATVHAKKLAKKGISVFILGGELKSSTEAVIGSEAVRSLLKYNFTKGFFGTNGVSRHIGFSTPDIHEALIKTEAVNRSKEKYILSDSTKFDLVSPVTFCAFDDAVIITGKIKKEEYKKFNNIMEVV